MEKESAGIRFLVYAYDKEKFVKACNKMGIKPTKKIRELMLNLIHTNSIDSFMREPHALRAGMFMAQCGGQASFSVHVDKKDRDEFYAACRKLGYTPSFVLRYMVQDFCDKEVSKTRLKFRQGT